MKRVLFLLISLLVFSLILSACGAASDSSAPESTEHFLSDSTVAVVTTADDTTGETTAEAMTEETTAEETTAEETTAEETTAEETTAEETTAEETAAPITYTAASWMNALPDERSLGSIAIPGTHDSGATKEAYGISGTAKCQDMTIAEQLAAGVRFLDIRLCRVEGELQIYHGDIDQKLTFDEVLTACYSFLAENKGEAIIMCIKEETDAKGTNADFDVMVKDKISENADRWYTGGDVPSLGSARGKIVLMRRYSTSGTYGFNASSGWKDNDTFTLTTAGGVLKCQDYYQNESGEAKWAAISAFFDEMKPADNTYCLNYTSGYVPGLFSIPNIQKTAEHVRPLLLEYLKTSPDIVGVFVMDYVTEALAEAVYLLNFD